MQESRLYNATGLHRSLEGISELQLPKRPRIVLDVEFVNTDHGYLVVGGEPQLLAGRGAHWIVTTLIPVLTGALSVSELVSQFSDISPEGLVDALHLLHMHGLIEDADDSIHSDAKLQMDSDFSTQLRFSGRYLRMTGANSSCYEAQRKVTLARVNVMVESDTNAVGRFVASLTSLGVGTATVSVVPPSEIINLPSAACRGYDLIVVIGGSSYHLAFARHALLNGCVFLTVNDRSLTLGPITFPKVSACPTCARIQYANHRKLTEYTVNEEMRTSLVHLMLSFAAQQIFGLLTDLYEPILTRQVIIWRQISKAPRYECVDRLPSCPTCGDGRRVPRSLRLGHDFTESAALLYHTASALKPWHMNVPAGMQRHFDSKIQRLNSAVLEKKKSSITQNIDRTHGLPPVDAISILTGTGDEVAPTSVSASTLGALLDYASGKSTKQASSFYKRNGYRIASSGGLGSAELYVFALDAFGLASGAYYFNNNRARLELLRRWQVHECKQMRQLWRSTFRSLSEAPIVLAIVSEVGRLAVKYGARAYHFGLLDAGLLAHRLFALSTILGLNAEVVSDLDQRIFAKLIGLGRSAIPQVVVAIGHGCTPKQATTGKTDG